MTDRKWRPTSAGVQNAGDYFGDFQVGDAYVVTYHLDGAFREYMGEKVPMVRVSVYFGVVGTPDEQGVAVKVRGARYAPTSVVSLERLDVYGEVIEEVTEDNASVFPFDYTTYQVADIDRAAVAHRWQSKVWGVADFWDGRVMSDG